MSTLCAEAEEYIKTHNKKLSATARAKLAQKDPKRQVQWLVNPMVMFFIEQTEAQIWSNLSTHRTAATPVTTTKTEKPEPEPEPSDDSDDDAGTFDLFGD